MKVVVKYIFITVLVNYITMKVLLKSRNDENSS